MSPKVTVTEFDGSADEMMKENKDKITVGEKNCPKGQKIIFTVSDH